MNRGFVRSVCLCLLASSVAGLVENRRCEAADEEARSLTQQLWKRAKIAYDLGNYDSAISDWTRAYESYPDPRILFNLAQAFRKRHSYERSLELYRQYLQAIPNAVNRHDVEELLRELEKRIEEQNITNSKPPQGAMATGVPPMTVHSRIEERRPWYTNTIGWSLVGSGVLALGGSLWLWNSAASLQDRVATASDSELAGLRSDISTRRSLATVTTVLGGLAFAGGVTVFIVSTKTVSRAIVPLDDIAVSLGPGTIALSGKF